jgi:carbonic anhydrase
VSFTWEPFGQTRRMTEPAAAAPASVSIPSRKEPRRRLVVITCMDARIDPLAVLGLRLGDANVIRNAGATVSDDVLRSLGAAVSKLGVVRAVVMGHTDCAGHGSDQAASASVVDGARRVRGAMPDGFAVEALMYDVRTGAVTPL